mgnify:CR=1 FL=1
MAKVTELNALEAAIEALNSVQGFDQNVLEKLRHMADNRKRTSGAKNAYANSKAAQEVRERAAGVLGYLLKQTEPRTNREIGSTVPGFLNPEGNVSPRRVVAALTNLKKQGLVEEAGKNKGGYATYQVTEKAREEWAAKQA